MAQRLVLACAQINPVVGDLAHNRDLILSAWDQANHDLIVFPELSLTGYMPEDLLLKPSFLDAVDRDIAHLVEASRTKRAGIVVGAPIRAQGHLYNAALLIHDGKILGVCTKHVLPNYGVFDEKRYFTSGDLARPLSFKGFNLGVMICEDMWFAEAARHLKDNGADLLIVLNGSPYDHRKQAARLYQARRRTDETGLPLLYVNQVGGQDDLVYDGGSFMLNDAGEVLMRCADFVAHIQHVTFERTATGPMLATAADIAPDLAKPAALYQAAVLGLRDYVEKNHMPGVLLGLSGGIDSALAAALAVDALGPERVRCVMLPSDYTSALSRADAKDCAARLHVTYEEIPIAPLMQSFTTLRRDVTGLAHENLQSRLRGLILMTLSNQSGAIVLSTGNKSELACGYATLYGDMCGGYNCLKDLYKTQIYELAEWRNRAQPHGGLGPAGEIINSSILTKAPSAELKPGQTDQDSLPPYEILDRILSGLIEDDLSVAEITAQGFDRATIEKINRLLNTAEYKRRQSPPGPKVSTRAFTRERRYPMVNGFDADDA